MKFAIKFVSVLLVAMLGTPEAAHAATVSRAGMERAQKRFAADASVLQSELFALPDGEAEALAEADATAAQMLAERTRQMESDVAAFQQRLSDALEKANALSYFEVLVTNLVWCTDGTNRYLWGTSQLRKCAKGAVVYAPLSIDNQQYQDGIDWSTDGLDGVARTNLDGSVKAKFEPSGSVKVVDRANYISARQAVVQANVALLKRKADWIQEQASLAALAADNRRAIWSEFASLRTATSKRLEVAKQRVLAARRALKGGGNYVTAFSTAMTFEFNRRTLDDLAGQSISSFRSLKSVRGYISITLLSEEADAIGDRYSFGSASAFNRRLGNSLTKGDGAFAGLLASSLKELVRYSKS